MIELESEQLEAKKVKKEVTSISTFMFLLSSTYTTFSMVIVYIHQKFNHNGVGQMYLTANNLSFIVFSFLAPWLIKKSCVSPVQWFTFSAFCYFLNVFVPALFSSQEANAQVGDTVARPSAIRLFLEVTVNILGGGTSSICWVLYGIYMARSCEKIMENRKGHSFSLSNLILNSRNIFGPVFTIFGLGYGNEQIFFGGLSVLAFLSIFFPYFFINNIPIVQNGKVSQGQGESQENFNERREIPAKIALQEIKKYFMCLCEIKNFVLVCVVCGSAGGFMASSLGHLLPQKLAQKQENDVRLGVALLFYGLGCILGGYVSGILFDKFSQKIKTGIIGIVLIVITCLMDSVILYYELNSLFSASLIAFIMSFAFAYLNCFLSIVCTVYFDGKAEAFAIIKQIIVVSFIAYQWFVAIENNQKNMRDNMIYQSCALALLAAISQSIMVKFSPTPKQHFSQNSKIGNQQMTEPV